MEESEGMPSFDSLDVHVFNSKTF